jgi:hypothetical protein
MMRIGVASVAREFALAAAFFMAMGGSVPRGQGRRH